MPTYRLYSATSGPGAQQVDASDYTLGVEFTTTSASASATHLHFWSSATLAGTFTGRIYTVDTGGTTGTAVSGTDVTFGSIVAGWNSVALTSPVALTANQHYVACVQFTTDNGYTATTNYWAGGGPGASAGITSGTLHAFSQADALGNRQGRYNAGSSMAFPANTSGNANYWIDVTINDVAPVAATASLTLGGLQLRAGAGYRDTYEDVYDPAPEAVVAHTGSAALALGTVHLAVNLVSAPPVADPDRDELNVSLYAVNPTTGTLTALPHFTRLAVSEVRNGIGKLEVDYPVYGLNFDLLAANITADRDLEVEAWLVGRRAGAVRGILTDTAGDDLAEDAVWTFEGWDLNVLLDEVLVWPQAGAEDQELVLTGNDAGTIVSHLITQAQTRGGLVGVTCGFTTAVDSNGDVWANVVTATFSPTATLLDVLQELIEISMIDGFRLGPDRVLRMWNPDGQGEDRTALSPFESTFSDTFGDYAQPLVFRRGQNLTESPRRHTVRNSATTALAVGADNLYVDADDVSARARRGRRIEIAASSNSLKDAGSVTAYAQAALTTLTPGTLEVTHGLLVEPGRPLPWISYNAGDWVWSDTRNTLDRLRIQQLELEYGPDGYAGSVVLNTAVVDRVTAIARKLKRISSGTAVVGTSATPPTEPDIDDGLAPAQVLGVTASSAAYIGNDGVTWASVQAGWTAVTTNVDTSPADDIVGYYPAYRYTDVGMPSNWQVLPQVASSPTDWSGVVPGKTVEVMVAAVDRWGHIGAWSSAYGLTSGADATPPPVPSTPNVDSYLGILTVAWDGFGSVGEVQPVDFARVDVHVSTSSGFTPSGATKIDSLRAKGIIPWDGGTYGVTYYAKLIAYDKTGNASTPSAQDSATLVQAGDGDISALSIGKLSAGIMSAIMTISGIIRTASSGDRVEIDADGIHCYNGSTLVFDFDVSSGATYLRGTIEAYQSTNDRIVIQPSGSGSSGVSLPEISFYAQPTSPAYQNAFDAGSGRTGLGINSGNSADSGTTRRQTTLQLRHDYFILFYNTAPGDSAGSTVRRGAEVFGDDTSAKLSLYNSSGLRTGGVAVTGDTISSEILDATGNLEGGYCLLSRDGAASDTVIGVDDGTIDTYLGFTQAGTVELHRVANQELIFSSSTTRLTYGPGIQLAMNNSTTILGHAGNTFIRLNNSGNIEFYENNIGYSSLASLKSFVIDHPTDPDRLLVHVCTESPTAGVEYTGTAVVQGGAATVQLPDYFEALCEPAGRTVQLTPVNELCLVAASPVVDGRFTVKCSGPDGTAVDWHVRATRRNAAFDVEPLRGEVHVAGSGPYRWISPEPTLVTAVAEPQPREPRGRRTRRPAPRPRRPA